MHRALSHRQASRIAIELAELQIQMATLREIKSTLAPGVARLLDRLIDPLQDRFCTLIATPENTLKSALDYIPASLRDDIAERVAELRRNPPPPETDAEFEARLAKEEAEWEAEIAPWYAANGQEAE